MGSEIRFMPMNIFKLIFMCIATAGVHHFYWFYKHFSMMYDKKILKTIGAIFNSQRLFDFISTNSKASNINLKANLPWVIFFSSLSLMFWFAILGGFNILFLEFIPKPYDANILFFSCFIMILIGFSISLPLAFFQNKINKQVNFEKSSLKYSISFKDLILIIIVFIINAPLYTIDVNLDLPPQVQK